MTRKILPILFIVIFLTGCNSTKTTEDASSAVESYFTAWNNHDYETMYSVISDGFRALEPTAATFEDFKAYADAQGISSVRIISIKQTSNDGMIATADYKVEFLIKDTKLPYQDSFTIKYKPNDSVPGWKLIHPYG